MDMYAEAGCWAFYFMAWLVLITMDEFRKMNHD